MLLCLGGCTAEPPPRIESAPAEATAPESSPVEIEGPVIVAFGDSLTAGYGVPRGESYPDFLQQELLERGFRYRVVNEGVSGDTTAVAVRLSSAP